MSARTTSTSTGSAHSTSWRRSKPRSPESRSRRAGTCSTRTTVFEVDGRVVVIDYAHNEDGMRGLIEICQGLRAPGGRIVLAFGSAGDRTNAILHRLAYTAARGPDQVAIAELHRYLRGRDPQDLVRRLQAGLADGGEPLGPGVRNALHGVEGVVWAAGPD